MEAFKSGDIRFLVATDVAARGIDVTQVTHVLNFDVPIIYEDYVHRIGRTGRAEHFGSAITFANEAEMIHIREIEKIIKMNIPESPLPPVIKLEDTLYEEKQEIDQEIDRQKRKADPDFKGAFHEKKIPLHLGIDKRTGRRFEEKKTEKKRTWRKNR
jgi:ATP-dependent RNA helicase RhlE